MKNPFALWCPTDVHSTGASGIFASIENAAAEDSTLTGLCIVRVCCSEMDEQ